MAGPRSRPAGILAIALFELAALVACGAGESAPEAPASQPPAVEAQAPLAGPPELAVLRVRDLGEVRIELLPEKAPKTVAHFKQLAESGFFDGTTFHRVIPDFMIQGGDPNTRDRDPRNDGKGGPGHNIPDELSDVSHARGSVSMANRGRPNSGGSQFFIVVSDSPHLDGKYSVFGRVTAGMEVADRVAATPRDEYGRYGPPDRPLDNVVVESVRIELAAATTVTGTPGEAEAGTDGTPADPQQPASSAAPATPGAPANAGTPAAPASPTPGASTAGTDPNAPKG